ncbi:preprotein translocase subunit SecA [Candidatus Parcubacteria bacterium]|nr:MAG: preprotein translocase subunit SecA [Candidatus Parcubacteria bacterium]
MGLLAKIWGDPNERVIRSLRPLVEQINALEPKYEKFSNEALRDKVAELKGQLGTQELSHRRYRPAPAIKNNPQFKQLQEKLNRILPDAFALVREAAKRTLGQRHYDVQLIGGIILHRGEIAEMRTGEGKTLVATLPLFLNGLTGLGVHLVTVNDYLSRVGAGWMAPVYHLLGLSVGVIVHDSAFVYDPDYIDESQYDDRLKHFRPVARREAYDCDILYGTNNEFGFDYLRDNMVSDLSEIVQREFYYSIVDEVDSILIDEARTPLIISAPAEESTDKYYQFAELVRRLKENQDYNVDEKMKAVTLTEEGISKMEKWLGIDNIYTSGGVREVHHIEQALKAHVLFQRDRDYVVKDGEVIIVDEFTGRLMPGRRYSEGLHQAIEAKEGVRVQRESRTFATITFQNYFRMYPKLAGMTGTAATEAEEFSKIYNLETVIIPTHKPTIRKDYNDLIFRTEEGKFKAVIRDVKKRHQKGQPVLVGTISIEKNERLALMMEREGLRPQILNAKNHEKEARIISEAGKVGAITIATNMAGRGVDIMLGGKEPAKDDPAHQEWKKEHQKVIELGGLHVIGTERHESRRIDNQLRGRAGRQGDPGSSQFYVSAEDDLLRIFGGERIKRLMATLRVPEDMPIENRLLNKSLESAQRKVEGHNFDIRKHLVEYDDVINKHREAIYRRRREILLVAALEENKPEAELVDREAILEKNLSDLILEMIENEIEQVVSFHTAAERIRDWNLKEIYEVMNTIFPVDKNLEIEIQKFAQEDSKLNKAHARTKIIERLLELARKNYRQIKERAAELGINWTEIEKAILLRSIDTLWVEHLEVMANMRQGIGLRGYGQRDPLVEYKKEGYRLYNELNSLIQKEVVYSIYKVGSSEHVSAEGIKAPNLTQQAKNFIAPSKVATQRISSLKIMAGGGEGAAAAEAVSRKQRDAEGKKIGRNDPCPCGSGKKFKKCCGR